MNQTPDKQQFNPNIIRRKSFIVQKFICFLIILRMYLVQIPLWIWALLLVLLYALKLRRQGNIPSSVLVFLAILCSVLGEYFQINFIYLAAPIIAGISHFFSYKIYWFPKVNKPVGMRQQILQNDTYVMELYPIKKNENVKKRIIPWNHRLEMKKILAYEEAKGPIYGLFLKFLSTAWYKIKIYLAEGDQQPCNQAIIFSHGRGSTPGMYSQLLSRVVSFETQNFDIFSPQHTQKNSTGQTQNHKIKKYRQIQVQVRAAQMFSTIEYCKKKRIVMMGHSYGGATTLQTYLCLSQQDKNKVSHLILLDPWLFPLTQAKLKSQVDCPVLILANEYFLENQHVYKSNKQFMNANKKGKIIYLTWKNGDHLHQTDMCFMLGNIMNRVKNSELSLQMLNKNLKAIQIFLCEKKVTQQKMRQTFKQDILPLDWKPEQWHNTLAL